MECAFLRFATPDQEVVPVRPSKCSFLPKTLGVLSKTVWDKVCYRRNSNKSFFSNFAWCHQFPLKQSTDLGAISYFEFLAIPWHTSSLLPGSLALDLLSHRHHRFQLIAGGLPQIVIKSGTRVLVSCTKETGKHESEKHDMDYS